MEKGRQVLKKLFSVCWPVLIAVFTFITAEILKCFPLVIEDYYSKGFYPFFSQAVSYITRWIPVSLSEILLLACPFVLAWAIVLTVKKRITWQRLLRGILLTASLLYASFSFFWGLNYYRLPYAQVAGYDVQPSTTAELRALVEELAAEAADLRAQLTKDEENPYDSGETMHETLGMVDAAYAAAASDAPWLSGSYGAPKRALLSYPMAHMQIAGIFLPFTLEAHVTSYESPLMLPATACHEAAHQRGFAREDEANYIAYYICTRSGNTRFAYSGTLLALIHAGNQLASADGKAYAQVRGEYSQGVNMDLAAYSANWAQYEGKASEVQEKMNDAYLRANGLTDGVRSYGRMVDLLLAERRLKEG